MNNFIISLLISLGIVVTITGTVVGMYYLNIILHTNPVLALVIISVFIVSVLTTIVYFARS